VPIAGGSVASEHNVGRIFETVQLDEHVSEILLLAAPVGASQSCAALWLDAQIAQKIAGHEREGSPYIDKGVYRHPLAGGADKCYRVEEGAHVRIIPGQMPFRSEPWSAG
jgi:hypothetical protein